MRVVVDRNQCEANGMCESLAPETFRVNDQDELEILAEVVSEAQIADVEAAVYRCPKQALRLEPE